MYFDSVDFIFSNNCLFLVETYLTNKLQMLTSPCFTRYVVNTAPKVATFQMILGLSHFVIICVGAA